MTSNIMALRTQIMGELTLFAPNVDRMLTQTRQPANPRLPRTRGTPIRYRQSRR
jgi:hypothetical protein